MARHRCDPVLWLGAAGQRPATTLLASRLREANPKHSTDRAQYVRGWGSVMRHESCHFDACSIWRDPVSWHREELRDIGTS